ncbi:MAG: DUF4381 domain-containing protein [Burkholderiaceae bacterium]
MTPENALLQLRDIHLPLTDQGVGALPIWVLPVCAAAITLLIWLWLKRQRAHNWQRQTERELDDITHTIENGELQLGWQRLGIVLRQLALLHGSQHMPASCTGDQWLSTLDQIFSTDKFTGADGLILLKAPYQAPSELPIEQSKPALLRLIQTVRDTLPSLDSPRAS